MPWLLQQQCWWSAQLRHQKNGKRYTTFPRNPLWLMHILSCHRRLLSDAHKAWIYMGWIHLDFTSHYMSLLWIDCCRTGHKLQKPTLRLKVWKLGMCIWIETKQNPNRMPLSFILGIKVMNLRSIFTEDANSNMNDLGFVLYLQFPLWYGCLWSYRSHREGGAIPVFPCCLEKTTRTNVKSNLELEVLLKQMKSCSNRNKYNEVDQQCQNGDEDRFFLHSPYWKKYFPIGWTWQNPVCVKHHSNTQPQTSLGSKGGTKGTFQHARYHLAVQNWKLIIFEQFLVQKWLLLRFIFENFPLKSLLSLVY